MIDAIILSAGKGERLSPLTDKCPKPMLSIGGQPAILFNIRLCSKHHFNNIAINLFHCPDSVISFLKDGEKYGVNVFYSKEKFLLGSAGGCREISKNYALKDDFVVIYGDVISNVDLTRMFEFHKRVGSAATIGTYQVQDPERCGVVRMDSESRVVSIVEKPDKYVGNLVNAGIYILSKKVLGLIPDNVCYDFASDLFPQILRRKLPIYAYKINDYLIDMGTPENYAQVQVDFKRGLIKC